MIRQGKGFTAGGGGGLMLDRRTNRGYLCRLNVPHGHTPVISFKCSIFKLYLKTLGFRYSVADFHC